MRVHLPLEPWYHDLCSCLQVDAACVLSYFGHEPLMALGAGWGFCFRPDDWEPVEFFYPTPSGDLGRALAPHHPLLGRWRRPAGPAEADTELIKMLQEGVPPIVAVDNYHLPFRPAYHDVHAAHLVVVHGYDSDQNAFDVFDPIPPAFQGQLPAPLLYASRASENPNDGSDPFFAGSHVNFRWLELRPAGEFPALTKEWVEYVLAANRDTFLNGAPLAEGFLSGLAGLQMYLTGLPERVMTEGERVLREIYVLGWAVQAATSLHADFLALAGDRLNYPVLREAGRWVALVAHEWTALRMAAAHAVARPESVTHELGWLRPRMLNRWLEALAHIEKAQGRRWVV